jgi:hypothetical protein
MARKIKKNKEHGNRSLKVKSRILPMLTFGHSNLNILSYRSSFDANSIVLDSLLEDLLVYQIAAEHELI